MSERSDQEWVSGYRCNSNESHFNSKYISIRISLSVFGSRATGAIVINFKYESIKISLSVCGSDVWIERVFVDRHGSRAAGATVIRILIM